MYHIAESDAGDTDSEYLVKSSLIYEVLPEGIYAEGYVEPEFPKPEPLKELS